MTSALRFFAGTVASVFFSVMASRIIIGGDTHMVFATMGFIGYMGGVSIDVIVCLYHLWFNKPCGGRGFPRCAACTMRGNDVIRHYRLIRTQQRVR